MTGTSLKYEIEPFDGKSNFSIWQSTVKDILVQQGQLKVLKGTKPESTKQDEWDELTAKAVATIRLALAPEIKYQVLNETSPKKLWEKLESIYMSKSLSNRLFMKKSLYLLRMQEGTSVTDHINEFNRLVSLLASIDVKLEDEDKALLLLNSLPDSYTTFQTALFVGRNSLTTDDVITALLDSDRFKGAASSINGEGYVASSSNDRGRSRSRYRSSDRRRSQSRGGKKDVSEVECYFCHQKGHYRNKCEEYKTWRKQQKKKNKGKKNADAASIAEETDASDGELYLVSAEETPRGNLLSVRSSTDLDGWYMDSGCSFHMCYNKDWFHTLTLCNGGAVLMGNNAVCKVTGIGTIKIKMFDGVVRTLGDVRYIPELRKNLISVGAMDSLNCSVSVREGVMKVSKGSLIIMKGQKAGNLYKLIGSTVEGGAAIASEEDLNVDSTELWHMRLGHLSEGGIKELHKRKLLHGVKSCKLEFCKFCVLGKQRRVSFKKGSHTTKDVLDYVHSDVWGPTKDTSHGGAR